MRLVFPECIKRGANSVFLSLEYANQFSLRSSGYIDLTKFPTWKAGPPGYNSELPIYLRVEKTSDKTLAPDSTNSDKKLKNVHVKRWDEDRLLARTVTGLEPNTQYTAFAYAKYEGGLTQGHTDKKPFVQTCFTTKSAGD